jgi:hypothetical protein
MPGDDRLFCFRITPGGNKQAMLRFAISKPLVKPRRFCTPSAFLLAVLLSFVSVDIAAPYSAVADRAVSEYEVKAAYVYNFAKFVEWPQIAFPSKNSPITIGVVGDDEFGALLEKTVKDKLVQEHTIQVRLLKWPADLRTCSIVYISSSEQKRFHQIAESLLENPVLTITETDEGSQVKGIMNLFIEGGKVQFEVNITAAEKVKLRISSKLLRLARETVGSYSGKGE